MNVIALGTAGTYPRFGRACSGYLFADDPTFVQVDLGTGTLANLFRYLAPEKLTAIVITHLHADHVLDIYPLRYYLQYNHREVSDSIKVYAPQNASAVLHGFNPGKENNEFLTSVFEFKTIEEKLTIGSLSFSFKKTKHVVPTYAVLCENCEGKKVGYTSDTSYSEELVEFFKNCDVLICEAAYQGKEGIENLHMSAYEAGLFASEADVKKLYLTHIWPELDPSVSKKEAEDGFGSEVIILKEHMVIEV